MTYIPLHTTLSSDTVSETIALNNNYLEIDQQLQGFQAANGGSKPISVTQAEIGMQIYSSYVPDNGGAPIYVSDGTNWHTSDQKETWGTGWHSLTPSGDAAINANDSYIGYRISNFNRMEWSIVLNWWSNPTAGVWTPCFLAAAGGLPWATNGPNAVGGAAGPFIFEGGISSDVAGAPGFGEMYRFAFQEVNVSGTNYLQIMFCFTALALSSSGVPSAYLNCMYDAGSGYAGCLS